MKAQILKSPSKSIKHLEKIGSEFKKSGQVKVGLPKNSNAYPDGTSVVMVGAVHEFGSPSRKIPERSYLRSSVRENKNKYRALMRRLSLEVIRGKMSSERALNILGLTAQTNAREKITDIKTPKLKYREGNPLVDTGHLRQSITFEVSK